MCASPRFSVGFKPAIFGQRDIRGVSSHAPNCRRDPLTRRPFSGCLSPQGSLSRLLTYSLGIILIDIRSTMRNMSMHKRVNYDWSIEAVREAVAQSTASIGFSSQEHNCRRTREMAIAVIITSLSLSLSLLFSLSTSLPSLFNSLLYITLAISRLETFFHARIGRVVIVKRRKTFSNRPPLANISNNHPRVSFSCIFNSLEQQVT